jgi:hypothetical protein
MANFLKITKHYCAKIFFYYILRIEIVLRMVTLALTLNYDTSPGLRATPSKEGDS